MLVKAERVCSIVSYLLLQQSDAGEATNTSPSAARWLRFLSISVKPPREFSWSCVAVSRGTSCRRRDSERRRDDREQQLMRAEQADRGMRPVKSGSCCAKGWVRRV